MPRRSSSGDVDRDYLSRLRRRIVVPRPRHPREPVNFRAAGHENGGAAIERSLAHAVRDRCVVERGEIRVWNDAAIGMPPRADVDVRDHICLVWSRGANVDHELGPTRAHLAPRRAGSPAPPSTAGLTDARHRVVNLDDGHRKGAIICSGCFRHFPERENVIPGAPRKSPCAVRGGFTRARQESRRCARGWRSASCDAWPSARAPRGRSASTAPSRRRTAARCAPGPA